MMARTNILLVTDKITYDFLSFLTFDEGVLLLLSKEKRNKTKQRFIRHLRPAAGISSKSSCGNGETAKRCNSYRKTRRKKKVSCPFRFTLRLSSSRTERIFFILAAATRLMKKFTRLARIFASSSSSLNVWDFCNE